jgi:hypothetical protein
VVAEELVKRGELVSDDIVLKILTNKLDTLRNQVSLSESADIRSSSAKRRSHGFLMVSLGLSDKERS